MKLLDKILVAVDFTPSSEETVKIATGLAKRFEADIVLIHILPPKEHTVEPVTKLLIELSEKKMNKMKELILKEGVKSVEIELKRGVHVYQILEYANTQNIDLIVTGAGEKEQGEAFKLGTTAEKIIKGSKIPVWTVKKNETHELKNIVCPVDLSPVSRRALQDAIHLARRFKAKLTILHAEDILAHDYFRLVVDKVEVIEDLSKEHFESFNAFVDSFDFFNVEFEKVYKKKKPSTEILKLVKEINADLLVMGTSGKTGLNRIVFGSVAEKVTREVPCSFVTVKTEEVFKVKLKNVLNDIESHYKRAIDYFENGFTKEALNEFKYCILLNDLHLPSWEGLVKVYERLGEKENAENTKRTAHEIQQRIWNVKIEAEIRKHHELFNKHKNSR